ncbi:nucleotide-diphospho-sugar transferase [Byssothecium circinans]|uniref:Nucleotide-diphospho-sugar transferase n=1 Tax=Byssothecium circinans TaxID=147558 RepID=A0A6A5TYD8_9PLEO|nr:nucleotide-diphospho-sugar transferase [Byssothecium circinans]
MNSPTAIRTVLPVPTSLASVTTPASNGSLRLPAIPEVASELRPLLTSSNHGQDTIEWSKFAYVQYVTDASYLCNSLMMLESLRRLGTKADLVMLYPQDWEIADFQESAQSPEGAQLAQARDEYGVNLVPIEVQSYDRGDSTWQDSYTKLLLFNQTQYKRVIHLDSDGSLFKTMDELFFLPSATCAMARGYWLDPIQLTTVVVVAEPSTAEFARIQNFTTTHEDSGFDMDIIDKIYNTSALIIPHRRYMLLTGEFRWTEHANYLGNEYEVWNATKELAETRYVHWSEWPLPKPWVRPNEMLLETHQPKCKSVEGEGVDCRDRDAYLWLRGDFTRRRLVSFLGRDCMSGGFG